MTPGRIAGAVLLLSLAALTLARLAPPIVNTADIGVSELYVDLASHGRLLVGPYSRFHWHHPGPLYFYVQAPLYAAAGRSGAALYAGAWAINLAAFGLLLWTLCAERSAALTPAVGAAILACAWRLPDFLASPWTAHVAIMALLAFVTTAAAVASGRTALLPATVVLASFVTQTNLALLPAVAVSIVLLTPAVVRARRSPGQGVRHTMLAAALGFVAWLPTLVDMLVNRGGNAAALWAFFSRPGLRHSFREAFAAWSFSVPALARGNLELPWGKPLVPTGVPWAPAAAIAVTVLTAVVTIMSARRERRFEAWLGTMLTVSLLVTLVSLTRVFEPIGDYHVLSLVALGAMAGGIILAGCANAAFPALDNVPPRGLRLGAVAAWLATAGLAAVHFQHAVGLQQRLPWAADVVPAVDRIERYLDGRHARAAVVDVGGVWSQGVPIVLRLRQHHRRLSVEPADLFIFTDAFGATGKEDVRLMLRPGRQAPRAEYIPVFDSWTIGVLAEPPREERPDLKVRPAP